MHTLSTPQSHRLPNVDFTESASLSGQLSPHKHFLFCRKKMYIFATKYKGIISCKVFQSQSCPSGKLQPLINPSLQAQYGRHILAVGASPRYVCPHPISPPSGRRIFQTIRAATHGRPFHIKNRVMKNLLSQVNVNCR